MDVFRRGKKWHYVFSIDGERFRGSCKTEDETKARQYLAEQVSKAWRGKKLGEKPRRTWEEAVERYLSEHRHLRSHHSYEYHRKWWATEFASERVTYLDEITPDLIKTIREREAARPRSRGGGKRSAGDVNRKIALVRAVVRAAYMNYRWIDGVPPEFEGVHGVKERLRYLKPDEVMRLVKALPDGYGDMALMAVSTGLRRRNVLRMRWDQIDFGRHVITVDGVMMKNGETLVIPLNSTALEVLKRWQGKSEEWVFPMRGDKPLWQISSKVWSKACEKAGLTNLRWHDLRHTWASILRQNQVPTNVIQELGGWKDPRMVARYAHLDVSHLSQYANVFDEAFSGAVDGKLRKVG